MRVLIIIVVPTGGGPTIMLICYTLHINAFTKEMKAIAWSLFFYVVMKKNVAKYMKLIHGLIIRTLAHILF